jgi:GTP-binding protein
LVSGRNSAIPFAGDFTRVERIAPDQENLREQAIAWIEDDELVEVTPAAIRLRKAYLDPNERKKAQRAKEAG